MNAFLNFLSAVQGYIIQVWTLITSNWLLSLFMLISIVSLVLSVINLFASGGK